MRMEEDRTFLHQIHSAPVPACISVWRISSIAIALEDKMSVRGSTQLRMLASHVPGPTSIVCCQLATWPRKSDLKLSQACNTFSRLSYHTITLCVTPNVRPAAKHHGSES
jgi:hypothetical protein